MKTAVLCVHGIQGSPEQFGWIIESLPGDFHVENVLLPGHGGDVRLFSRSGMAQWQACVDEHLEKLRAEYDRIIYIGHSMGCLLGIHAAAADSSKIERMILLACPLKVRITERYIRQNLIAVSKKKSDNPFITAAREAHSVKAKYIWEYVLCIGPYIDLFRLIYSANGKLERLNVPVLAVFSEVDEIVSRKAMAMIQKAACCETYLAEGCGHLHYADPARREIVERIKRHIQNAGEELCVSCSAKED